MQDTAPSTASAELSRESRPARSRRRSGECAGLGRRPGYLVRLAAASALGPCLGLGCGGGSPLLHPAHALPAGRMFVGAGSSGTVAPGSLGATIVRAREVSAPGAAPVADAERQLSLGIAARALAAPGLAPWVGARLGLREDNEVGLLYSGRAARIDGRHVFDFGSTALSVGAGASALLARPGAGSPPSSDASAPGAGRIAGELDSLSPAGWGIDVPVLYGYRSQAEVLRAWAGARGVYSRIRGSLSPRSTAAGSQAPEDGTIEAQALSTLGLLGLSVGLAPVWASIEVDAGYQWIGGTARPPGSTDQLSLRVAGPVVTVGGALSTVF